MWILGTKIASEKLETMTGSGLESSHGVWISIISRVALVALNCM